MLKLYMQFLMACLKKHFSLKFIEYNLLLTLSAKV